MERTLKLTIETAGIKNEYVVEFPRVKDFIRIEALKQEVTGGTYGMMVSSNLASQFEAVQMADIVAYFTVLLPDFMKSLKAKGIDSIDELDAIDFNIIKKVYQEQFFPWYKVWFETLQKVTKEDETK